MNYNNVVFETSFGKASQLTQSDLVEIAFAGRSNVGKSSLINKIFNRRNLARVSAVPGKTATINFFRLENVRFADLPGYGYAKVAQAEKQRWSDLIETYFNSDRRIELVFQLIDMRHPPTKDDLMMVDFLIQNEFPFVIVLTKKDKLSKKQQEERMAALMQEIPFADQIHMIPFSAVKGDGVEQLRAIIDGVEQKDKIGVCMDTCHVSDAGYDIVSDLDGVLEEFDNIVGLERLHALHINDSLNPPGSHKDRHAKIGEGTIGLEAIANVIRHPKLQGLPCILETPNELPGYAGEIEILRAEYEK